MSLELLRRAMEHAETVVCDLTSDDLRLPTPCNEWNASRVVLHLADVADGLISLVETGDLALPEPARTDDPDPVSIAGESMTRLAATLSTTSETDRARVGTEPLGVGDRPPVALADDPQVLDQRRRRGDAEVQAGHADVDRDDLESCPHRSPAHRWHVEVLGEFLDAQQRLHAAQRGLRFHAR